MKSLAPHFSLVPEGGLSSFEQAHLGQNCGYYEFYAQDPSKLARLGESDNWKKLSK